MKVKFLKGFIVDIRKEKVIIEFPENAHLDSWLYGSWSDFCEDTWNNDFTINHWLGIEILNDRIVIRVVDMQLFN